MLHNRKLICGFGSIRQGSPKKERRPESLGGIVSVIGYAIAVVGAALGIGLGAYGVAGGIARQPEVQGRLFTVFILGAAFCEALALLGFVLALIS